MKKNKKFDDFFEIYINTDNEVEQYPILQKFLLSCTLPELLAWNDYLYQYLLLSSPRSMTVAAGINQFFDSDEAPWSYLMSVALVFSIPPIAVYYALRRYMVTGLTMGGVKG